MIVVGLTGSVGMGKSTTAAMFAEAGVPVYDADAEVRKLYAVGGAAVGPVEQAFPGVASAGAIDRNKLGERVLGDAAALQRLNRIVHPLLAESRQRFFRTAEAEGASLVVLDIPLLFETGGETAVNKVVVVTAPGSVQRQRVLARPGMTEAKLRAILEAQTPDAQKRDRADFVIDTALGFDAARDQVGAVISALRQAGKAGQ
ncbi:MAG TPA: dephospho-CoA kinase [Caulobacteraceae bacterium]|jgi:dephospho-CoA kinase